MHVGPTGTRIPSMDHLFNKMAVKNQNVQVDKLLIVFGKSGQLLTARSISGSHLQLRMYR